MSAKLSAVTATVFSVVAALLLIVLRPFDEPAPPAVTPPFRGAVIARIDGMPVYLSQAKARVDSLGGIHQEEADKADWGRLILGSMVDDKVVADEASRRGVALSAPEAAIATAQAARSLSSSQEEIDDLIADERERAALMLRVWTNVSAARLYESIGSKAEVTQEEVRSYFDDHRRDLYADLDPETAFLQVKEEIFEELLKKEQDALFLDWLRTAHDKAELKVLDPDWWEEL